MRVGSSSNIHRRCYTQHDGALRRNSHPCLALQNACTGIDGDRWRILVLEEVPEGMDLRSVEKWWRSHVENEFERDEHWDRYLSLSSDRRPSC